jgi:BRO family, N-terminal domain
MSEQMPAPPARNTFERIRRMSPEGNEYWSSRDFARLLRYTDYRNFEAVIEKARTACFSSGQRVEDHFVEITEMIEIGKGGQRPVQTVMLSRHAGYLVIQNADPTKALEELADDKTLQEDQKRLLLRAEMKKHNKNLAGVATLLTCATGWAPTPRRKVNPAGATGGGFAMVRTDPPNCGRENQHRSRWVRETT